MSSSKKIIIVGPAYPLRGGIANFNESLALELQKAGHTVELVSFYYQYPSLLFPGKSQYDTSEKAPKGLLIKSLISSINPLSWGKTASQILSAQPDLVIIRFWMPFMAPSLGSIAKKLRKKGLKVIAITDNIIPHEKRMGDHQLTQYFINQIDGFVAMSHAVLDDISTFTNNPNKIMLPHPVYNLFGEKVSRDEGIQFLKLDLNHHYLLFFGLIRGYKGLDLALKAMAETSVKDKNIHLIIAGEYYDKKEKYDALIADLGIAQRIIQYDHYIPADEVKYYFAVADCVLQPYKTATQSGITQVAYNFDTPMIVTNVGGLPEIVENGKVGFVVEVNEKSIAKGICQFYDLNLQQQFSEQVGLAKTKFSWSYFVEQLLSFANKLNK